MTLTTQLSAILPCTIPIICAPMAGAAGGLLAAQVSSAGGFGYIGTGHVPDTLDFLTKQLDIARESLQIEPGERLPIGVGFLLWRANEWSQSEVDAVFKKVVSEVSSIWLSFGDHASKYIALIRSLDPDRKCSITVAVTKTSEALDTTTWDIVPDIIVAQGNESGGHGAARALSVISLIPEVIDVLQTVPVGRRPLVVAAGGVSNAAQALAALSLGAVGVVCGTRFLATQEAMYTDKHKELIVKSKGEDTVRTMVFDVVRGTLGWPAGIDGRAISNATVTESLSGASDKDLTARYEEAMKAGDVGRLVCWAGSSVGSVKKTMAAAKVVKEIAMEMEDRIKGLHAFLG